MPDLDRQLRTYIDEIATPVAPAPGKARARTDLRSLNVHDELGPAQWGNESAAIPS